MHALDPETKSKLLPNLPPLTAAETQILNDNKEYFRRGATHYLAERLKSMKDLEPDTAKKIPYKWSIFQAMMTSIEEPEDTANDPVVRYGWSRETNAKELKTLQAQFINVSMRVYELGYMQQCPAWENYLSQPVYWFNAYKAYLLSDAFLQSWLPTLPDRSKMKGAVPVTVEVNGFGNKLSLLAHAAPVSEQAALKVDGVCDELNHHAQIYIAYSQIMTHELAHRGFKVSCVFHLWCLYFFSYLFPLVVV